ncbi:MAG: hypothetical protein L6264_00200 [Weeksellaceae bacterium]|uniref:DUF6759 domain-containing protein n=1 Tax=Kaistella soli TaxID=2849654 RepID=UPI001C26A93E|nr:DUF6759 domain-containing protein [Kaistella soli]MBU4537137.1 hypothetical protein [Bacteroidota bacterium]MBU8883927.1 hypothetical protein [Kaistella soli]MCG2779343.1 hypothetical protein [Weeksellaceae bacterium]
MKRYFYILLFFVSAFSSAQSKYTAAQVEKSTDPQVIANFIKYNPDHPKTPEFKRKLFASINNDKPAAVKASVAKPTVKPISTEKLKTEIKRDVAKDGTNDKHKRTADLLNHLFNTDPSSKTAYVQIVNKSKCNLIVKISGRNYYNLDVPANNQNFILVDKGNYTLTTSVCDAKYSSVKNISKDVVVTLNAPK